MNGGLSRFIATARADASRGAVENVGVDCAGIEMVALGRNVVLFGERFTAARGDGIFVEARRRD